MHLFTAAYSREGPLAYCRERLKKPIGASTNSFNSLEIEVAKLLSTFFTFRTSDGHQTSAVGRFWLVLILHHADRREKGKDRMVDEPNVRVSPPVENTAASETTNDEWRILPYWLKSEDPNLLESLLPK
jgi:hypothetical protein